VEVAVGRPDRNWGVDRWDWSPNATLRFPDIRLPVGYGQTRTAAHLPVLTMVTGYSRWLSALLIPSRRAEDLFAVAPKVGTSRIPGGDAARAGGLSQKVQPMLDHWLLDQ
jgi:hypothetical protein